jgi:hypothetical protein
VREADRVRSDAEGWAKQSVEEARAFLSQVKEDAGSMVSGVAERRQQMVEELHRMQDHLLSIARDLDVVFNPGQSGADARGTSPGVDTTETGGKP